MTETASWLREVADSAVDQASAVQQLLHAVRTQLGMQVAWTSEFTGAQQVFRFVDADAGVSAPVVGSATSLSGSFCSRVLDGRLPPLIPDTRRDPATALLDVTRDLEIGSYLGVPLLGADGTARGMLCAVSNRAAPTLSERDLATLRLLAQLLHDLQRRAVDAQAAHSDREAVVADLRRVIDGVGRWAVLQPVVDVSTGAVVMMEGLSRFDSDRTPAQWFDAATRTGMSQELELAAAATVLSALRSETVPVGAALSVNLGPDTLMSADLEQLLADVDPARVVLEVTEHCPVADYDALAVALSPWRDRGVRLAVDDAGAGFASLRHVLMCRPDFLKLDMALVRGVDADPVRRALIAAVVDFAATSGITVVAEGVETTLEHDALVSLGVPLLQGYLLGRPRPVAPLQPSR